MFNLKNRSDDLEILLAVVDSGGFSAAADALDIQVAKVSRAVSKIEKQLGITILNRTTRRVVQTDEGRQFIEAVRIGLSQIQQAEEDIISKGELPQGRLRVDAASPFVIHQLVPLINDFKLAFPNIELELNTNDGFVDLLEKKTDLAIRIGTLADSTLHARPIGVSNLYIVASPAYLEKRGSPLQVSQLHEHELIGFSGAKVLNHWPLKGFKSMTPAITASSGETIRQLALSGNGIACLSGFMVKHDIEQGTLVSLFPALLVEETNQRQINAVYYRSSKVARRITAFIDFIKPRLNL
ncbi:LysR family transcriptional regulator [Agarivorans sp. B2Z047]|uniref:LysR family transcriptional regulator n=1 Tax=Agarivorans sp. B2Z047 TaxID=2652721 RepID=UPI00128E1871|nr:LysR family transcriptional regulator [Agarivorans sp. B2Z047]MPW29624.1 LysR family transcriptional regulator [Agarivorans sp. B2Z047]UQN40578.1 LysR family transcriptional regulator [Agarivorans sp. B2Z047]